MSVAIADVAPTATGFTGRLHLPSGGVVTVRVINTNFCFDEKIPDTNYTMAKTISHSSIKNDPRNRLKLIPFGQFCTTYPALMPEFNCRGTAEYSVISETTPRPEQVAAMNAAMRFLNEKRSVQLILPTGFGKTYVTIRMLQTLRAKVIVVVYNCNVATQWVQSFIDHTDAKIFITDNIPFGRAKHKGRIVGASDDFQVAITTIGSISSEKSPTCFVEQYFFDYLVIDEVHQACTLNRLHKILEIKPRCGVIACTATGSPSRMPDLISFYAGPNIVKSDKIRKCIPSVVYLMTKKYEDVMNGNVPDSLLTMRAISRKPEFIAGVCLFLKRLCDDGSGDKILVMCRDIYALTAIKHVMYRVHSTTCATYYGKDTGYDPTCQILITTSNKAGTGFDEANFCKGAPVSKRMVIVTPFGSDLLFKQVTGRLRHENGMIYHISVNNNVYRRLTQLAIHYYRTQMVDMAQPIRVFIPTEDVDGASGALTGVEVGDDVVDESVQFFEVIDASKSALSPMEEASIEKIPDAYGDELPPVRIIEEPVGDKILIRPEPDVARSVSGATREEVMSMRMVASPEVDVARSVSGATREEVMSMRATARPSMAELHAGSIKSRLDTARSVSGATAAEVLEMRGITNTRLELMQAPTDMELSLQDMARSLTSARVNTAPTVSLSVVYDDGSMLTESYDVADPTVSVRPPSFLTI